MEKKQSISSLVLEEFDRNPKVGTDDLVKKIKSKFPKSKFNPTHVAWFKYQLRHKKMYEHRVKAQTLKALKLGEPVKAKK